MRVKMARQRHLRKFRQLLCKSEDDNVAKLGTWPATKQVIPAIKTDIDVVPGSGRKGYLILNSVFCVYARICYEESHLTHGEAMTRVLSNNARCMGPPAMGKRILYGRRDDILLHWEGRR